MKYGLNIARKDGLKPRHINCMGLEEIQRFSQKGKE
jgi:hypothetical protein